MSPEVSSAELKDIRQDIRDLIDGLASLRSVLLDFNERLVVAEQSDKFAEQFRLMLLKEVQKVSEKLDTLRDLPREVSELKEDFQQLKKEVRGHDDLLLQVQGGWAVAKYVWVLVSASVAALVSLAIAIVARKV